jgi:hypothetical protein
MTDQPETDPREGYCAGLEQLAAILRANPDVPLPTTGGKYSPVNWLVFSYGGQNEDLAVQKATAARIARALPCTVHKEEMGELFRLDAQLAGLSVQVIVDRPAVCERIVTGTEVVTKKVPDPAALAAVPQVEVTETVETVEWRCAPLLAAPAVEQVA